MKFGPGGGPFSHPAVVARINPIDKQIQRCVIESPWDKKRPGGEAARPVSQVKPASGQKPEPMTSPPLRETSEAITDGVMESAMNCTWPSPNTMLAPAVWKLKISSLGPQLFLESQARGGAIGPGARVVVVDDLVGVRVGR